MKFDPDEVKELQEKVKNMGPEDYQYDYRMPIRVMIIGDDRNDLRLATMSLNRVPGMRFTLDTVYDLDEVEFRGIDFCPQVAVMTGWPARWPDAGIKDALPQVMSRLPYTKVIVVTDGSPDQKNFAIGYGAKDVISINRLADYRLLPQMVRKILTKDK